MGNLNYFGIILWKLYTFEVYGDENSIYLILNLWNPISWIILLGGILYPFVMGGIPAVLEEYEDSRFCTKPSRYFRLNPNLIKRIPR